MQCKRCGAEFLGNFCPNCGQAAESAPQEAQPTYTAGGVAESAPQNGGTGCVPPQCVVQPCERAGEPNAQASVQAGKPNAQASVQAGDPAAAYAEQIALRADAFTPPPKHKFIADHWTESDYAAEGLIARIRTVKRAEFWGKICCGILVLIAVVAAVVWGTGKDPFAVLAGYGGARAAVYALVWIAVAVWGVLSLLEANYEGYVTKKCADWLRRQNVDLGAVLRADLTELMAMQKRGETFGKEEKLRTESARIAELCIAPKRYAGLVASEVAMAVYYLFFVCIVALYLTYGLFEAYAENVLYEAGSFGQVISNGLFRFVALFGAPPEAGLPVLWVALGILGFLIVYPLLVLLLSSVTTNRTKADKWLNEQYRLIGLKKSKKHGK